MKNKNGFTLVEVMVSGMILLMMVGIFSMGSGWNRNIKKKTMELEQILAEAGIAFAEKDSCISGIVSLNVDGVGEISKEGWLYCGKRKISENKLVEIIYVEPVKYEKLQKETIVSTGSNAETATDSDAMEEQKYEP